MAFFGFCRVLYQADNRRLTISLNGEALQQMGPLIILIKVECQF
jgi:hypothetical protein